MSAVLGDGPSITPAQRAHRRSVSFLRWLRRIHLYVGLWGAALGLLFGATGILLNHRAIMKIPLDKAVQRSAQLPLPATPPQRFRTPEEMAQWLQIELRFENPPQRRVRAEAPKRVVWADRELEQPARWTFSFQAPGRGVNAEYVVGNRFVKVDSLDATPIGTLTRLHMAVGVSAFWVLLSDTIAGGMIVLSVTGLLLWSRLHTIRLAAVGVSTAALLGGVWTLWSTV